MAFSLPSLSLGLGGGPSMAGGGAASLDSSGWVVSTGGGSANASPSWVTWAALAAVAWLILRK